MSIKPININGVSYASLRSASDALCVSPYFLKKRIISVHKGHEDAGGSRRAFIKGEIYITKSEKGGFYHLVYEGEGWFLEMRSGVEFRADIRNVSNPVCECAILEGMNAIYSNKKAVKGEKR